MAPRLRPAASVVPREVGRRITDQARALHHQGEPHVRPGAGRRWERQWRSAADHLRAQGYTQSAQPGRTSSCCSTTSSATAKSAWTATPGRTPLMRRTSTKSSGRSLTADTARREYRLRISRPPAIYGTSHRRRASPTAVTVNMPRARATAPLWKLRPAWADCSDTSRRNSSCRVCATRITRPYS